MRSFLVIRLSSLGDVLFALAAVESIKAAEPGARVTFMVEDRFSAVPRAHPGIDEVIEIPRKSGLGAVLAQLRAHRGRQFDAVFDLQGNARSALCLSAFRSSPRIGFSRSAGRELNFLCLTKQVSPPAGADHRVDRFLSLLPAAGIEARRVAPQQLIFNPNEVDRAAEILQTAGSLPKVVLHPGTSAFGLLKRWEPVRFGRLAKQLAFIPGAACFVTGGPGEENIISEAEEASCGGALGVAPFGNIMNLAAFVSMADVVVAADTGPLHLANRVGTPVVGLFGPKDPARYGPVYEPFSVLRREDVPCSPCTRRWCEAPACMAGLTVEEVAYATRKLLGKKKAV